MSDANDDNNGDKPNTGRAPLTLKPRPSGSVPSGTVRQSFSHGRSKTVVVETKRRRLDAPGGAPAHAEKRPAFDLKPRPRDEAPAAPQPPREPTPPGGLSAEEMEARRRAAETFRNEQDRRDAERREQEAS